MLPSRVFFLAAHRQNLLVLFSVALLLKDTKSKVDTRYSVLGTRYSSGVKKPVLKSKIRATKSIAPLFLLDCQKIFFFSRAKQFAPTNKKECASNNLPSSNLLVIFFTFKRYKKQEGSVTMVIQRHAKGKSMHASPKRLIISRPHGRLTMVIQRHAKGKSMHGFPLGNHDASAYKNVV